MKCLKPFLLPGGVFNHPCGGCAGCRLKRSMEWAVRCTHEASLWSDNCFITLTYDDLNLPVDRSLDKKYFQDFMKRFRKAVSPRVVRYFACGEYGDSFSRPHYHFICFNYDPRKFARYDESGRLIDSSDILFRAWGKGFVNVRDFNFERAQYVAKYIMKKLGGKDEKVYLDAGIIPEFSLMSKGSKSSGLGGIGYGYFLKFNGGFKDVDTLFCAGKEVGVPRYYRKKIEESATADHILERRIRLSKYRFREFEEIVRRSRLKGYSRSPRQYFKEVVSQRVKDFKVRQELKELIL